jgi:rSAM/selenodomain-associated transferase 2/rSAM/selenodomain-associated transferase 1
MMASDRLRLILFARFPIAGKVKTRLIPALGAEGAAALHRRLVLRTFRTAVAFCRRQNVDVEIRFDGGSEREIRHWLGDGWLCRRQSDGDLGQRMARAFEDSFHEGATAAVIIGSDCPMLTPVILAAAFRSLDKDPAVFGPATDGGYYLIGLRRLLPELFQNIPWGTETVLARSREILEHAGIKPVLLETLDDIDRPDDLPAWKSAIAREEADWSCASVVIPALNEAGQITATLASVLAGRPREILVVDGGSTDDTIQRARKSGAAVVTSQPGRARQMNAGAAQATGNVLVFLHADTLLPADWLEVVSGTLQTTAVAGGAFGFRVSPTFPGSRILEWATNLRSRWFQKPYGDQAFFMKRSLFEELGGFADMPIMEDYEFIGRLKKQGRIVTAAAHVLTSARRWRHLGLPRATLINAVVIAGYHLGASPKSLASLYQRPVDGSQCDFRGQGGDTNSTNSRCKDTNEP